MKVEVLGASTLIAVYLLSLRDTDIEAKQGLLVPSAPLSRQQINGHTDEISLYLGRHVRGIFVFLGDRAINGPKGYKDPRDLPN